MEKYKNGNTMILFLKGRISSQNAKEVDAEINLALQDDFGQLVLNFKEVEYISSAGLRIILRLAKKYPSLKCVALSLEVYDVFEMTGFTSLVSVEKEYRQLSIDGCECIGKGAKGDVYKLDEETIVKVYKDPDSLETIFQEKELSKAAFVAGIPTPISFDIVKVGELYGTVFEMLNAQSFASYLLHNPDEFETVVQKSVDILHTIHSLPVEEGLLPSIKQMYLEKIEDIQSVLSSKIYEKLKSMFMLIPDSLKVIHGDFHLKNIMMEKDEAMLIDMDTLSAGEPIFEFVPIYTAYVGHGELDPSIVEEYMGIPYDLAKKVCEQTLIDYFGQEKENVLKKIQLLSYVRLLSREIRKKHREEYLSYYTEKVTILTENIETIL
ncbi:MAG: phosphotransferase [Bacillota bacterium]|nr:phosphotransferase [Bacillota bacterium]